MSSEIFTKKLKDIITYFYDNIKEPDNSSIIVSKDNKLQVNPDIIPISSEENIYTLDEVGSIRYALAGTKVPEHWLRADGSEYDPQQYSELAKVLPSISEQRLIPDDYEYYDPIGLLSSYPLSNLFDGSKSYAHSAGTYLVNDIVDGKYHQWGFIFNEPVTICAWKALCGSDTAKTEEIVRGLRLWGMQSENSGWELLDDSHWPFSKGTGETGFYSAIGQLSFLSKTDKKYKKIKLDILPTLFSSSAVYIEELYLYGAGNKYILPNIPTTDTGLSYIVSSKKKLYENFPPEIFNNLQVNGNVYLSHSDADIIGTIKYAMPGSPVPKNWIRANGQEFDPIEYIELAKILPPMSDKRLKIISAEILDKYGINSSYPLSNLYDGNVRTFAHSSVMSIADGDAGNMFSWEFTLENSSEILGYLLHSGRTDSGNIQRPGCNGYIIYGQEENSSVWELLEDSRKRLAEGYSGRTEDVYEVQRIKNTGKRYKKIRLDVAPFFGYDYQYYYAWLTEFELYGPGFVYKTPMIAKTQQGDAYIVARMMNLDQRINVDSLGSDPVGTIKEIYGNPNNSNYILCDGSEFSSTDYPELFEQLGSGNVPSLTSPHAGFSYYIVAKKGIDLDDSNGSGSNEPLVILKQIPPILVNMDNSWDIDLSKGDIFKKTITSDGEFSFIIPDNMQESAFIYIILNSENSYNITFPSNIKWMGDIAPSTISHEEYIISFMTTDNGTSWYGIMGSF